MYSQDTLFLLIDKNKGISRKQIHENLVAYENAIDCFK